MAATMGVAVPQEGAPLPPGWHWTWFNEAKPAGELGRDGHPKLGGFMPPVPLPRRMWAGGRIHFHSPLLIGRQITRNSTITAVQEKSGRSGALCFVTVQHDFIEGDILCLSEEHDLVYREEPKPGESVPEPPDPPQGATVSCQITPDPVWLFRYSALTFNGHRIHYDVDYARDVEGYPGLVFHAPLTAILLMGLTQELLGQNQMAGFSFRAISPLFDTLPFHIHAKRENGKVTTWATDPMGKLAFLGEEKSST